MMEERPLINDTPGMPAHPMTDKQYADYLRILEEMAKNPPPTPDSTEQEQIDALRQENEDLWLALAQIELGGEMV